MKPTENLTCMIRFHADGRRYCVDHDAWFMAGEMPPSSCAMTRWIALGESPAPASETQRLTLAPPSRAILTITPDGTVTFADDATPAERLQALAILATPSSRAGAPEGIDRLAAKLDSAIQTAQALRMAIDALAESEPVPFRPLKHDDSISDVYATGWNDALKAVQSAALPPLAPPGAAP